jgi:hypothetical protein
MVTAIHEREYVSLNRPKTMGLIIQIGGVQADPDDNAVNVTIINEAEQEIVDRAATRMAEGDYQITLTPAETSASGPYTVQWGYEVGGEEEIFVTYIQIGDPSPAYDALSDTMKLVIEQTFNRFDDLYDSSLGGPHLYTYLQANFGRERMVHLLGLALNKLNMVSQPFQSFTAETFPAEWAGILEMALYVEVIRHLMRSYVEQPDLRGMTVGYEDRRDYLMRWEMILREAKEDLEDALEVFKMAFMGLGSPGVLVSGGVFGDYGPTRLPGSASARPRYYFQFH